MVDWGLQAGTEYHYQVTSVDRQGNESPPSAPLVVSTKSIERVLIELPAEAEWPSDGELEVPFELPREGDYALWLEIAPGEKVRHGEDTVSWRIDDGDQQRTRLWFDIVCKGHAGSTPGVFFWDTLRPTPARKPIHLTAGAHVLRISAPDIRSAQTRRMVITNDLGYLPEGITSWLGVEVW